MGESKQSGSPSLRYGCLGCLGVTALVVVVAAAVLALTLVNVRSEQVETRSADHEIPVAPESSATALSRAGAAEAPPSAPGRVFVHVTGVERCRIEPAVEGDPVRVEARYDTNAYELRERFETAEDSSWTYRVEFRRTGSNLITSLKELVSGARPEVRIFLPVGGPMSLQVDFAEGGLEADLGGLWLTVADIRFEKGGMDLEFADPLRAPMERLAIRGGMGGMSLDSLGNASPRELTIDFRMGGMSADLTGRWVQDSEITVDMSMGGGALRLPRDVNIEGLDSGRFEVRRPEEVGIPTLRFSVSSSMGDLEIVD